MATQDILVKYRVDVGELTNQLKIVAERMDKLEAESKQSAKGVDQLAKSVDNLDKELKETGGSTKKVTDNVKGFSKSAKTELNALSSSVKSIGSSIALAFGAAFSVDAIISFGKASINAFLEAQENAEKLRFTITQVGGESELAFERLIQQSQQLQSITIFSDDSIQQAQNALATFGLTSDQIEELLPKLADFASATKTDIVAAAQQVGAGLQGAGREFKKYGIEVSATATSTENLAKITDGFSKFQGAAAKETETLTGQLKQQANAADELQESIGARLAEGFVAARLAVFDFFATVIEGLEGVEKLNAKNEISDRERLALRIKADLQGRATVNNLTLQANAERELAETGRELRENQAEIIQNEIKQNPQRLTILRGQRQELIQTAGILTEIIELEKNRIANEKKLAQEASKEVSDKRIAGTEKEIKLIESLGAQYAELFALLDNQQKQQLIEISIQAELENQQDIENKIAILEDIAKENKIVVPIVVDENGLVDARKRFDDLKTALEENGINVNITVEDSDLDTLRAAVAKLASENPIEIPVKLEVPDDRNVGEFQDGMAQISETVVEDWSIKNEEIIEEIINASAQMLGDLASLWSDFSNQRIAEIDKDTEKQLDALDLQANAIEEDLKKRRISEKDAEKQRADLAKARVKIEEDAQKKINAEKRKQFNIEKLAALSQIIIQTAIKVVEAPIYLKAFYAALGLAQGAIVAARPNPYKKGTKSAKKGLALVDEEGSEAILRGSGRLTTLEHGDKVLTAPKTKTYGEVLDAMMDNRFDKYVMQKYVAPELERQRKTNEVKKSKAFAQNITESLTVNNPSNGKTDYLLSRMKKEGIPITNLTELAEIISSSRTSPYRR